MESSGASSKVVFMDLVKEIGSAVRSGDASPVIDKLPRTNVDREEFRRRMSTINRLHREVSSLREQINKLKNQMTIDNEKMVADEENMRKLLEQRISGMKANHERESTLKREHIDKLERECGGMEQEIRKCTDGYLAMDKDAMKKHFARLFEDFSHLLDGSLNNGERNHTPSLPSPATSIEKKLKDGGGAGTSPLDFDYFNNGENGYGSFFSAPSTGNMDMTFLKSLHSEVAKRSETLEVKPPAETITKRPPPYPLASSGSKLFEDEEKYKMKERDILPKGKGKAPVFGKSHGQYAQKVPRKFYADSRKGKKPAPSPSDKEQEEKYGDEDEEDEIDLVNQLKSKLPTDAVVRPSGESSFFSESSSSSEGEVVMPSANLETKNKKIDPFDEGKEEDGYVSSGDPATSSSTESSASDSDVYDDDNEDIHYGSFSVPLPEGYILPATKDSGNAHEVSEMQCEIQKAIIAPGPTPRRNMNFDDVMEEMEKLKVAIDPEIEQKRKERQKREQEKKIKKKRKKQRRSQHEKEQEQISHEQSKAQTDKSKRPLERTNKKDDDAEIKGSSAKKEGRNSGGGDDNSQPGRKRGRPADYETDVNWDKPKIPKVRLTKFEKAMSKEKQSNYGDYKSIPSYELAILPSGRCKYGGKHYKECTCKCFLGHTREQCGALQDDDCTIEMIKARHDGGFYVEEDRKKVVNLLRSETDDPITKKGHFKLARGYEIRFHSGVETPAWSLPNFVVNAIEWAAENTDHDERCPLCMCKDMVRKASYTICCGCKNSRKIKPYYEDWRKKAGVPVKKRKKRDKKDTSEENKKEKSSPKKPKMTEDMQANAELAQFFK